MNPTKAVCPAPLVTRQGGVVTSRVVALVGGGGSGGSATSATKGGTSSSGAPGVSGAPAGLTLYYIRHAEVVANTLDPSEVTYENSETLTEFGLSQIAELTTFLNGMGGKPDAVIVSPTKRTQKTIEPYLTNAQLRGEIWMELAECCTAAPTGAPLPTQPEYQSFLKAELVSSTFGLRSSELDRYWKTATYEAGLSMVMTARDEILRRYGQSGKTLFVVGHASAGQVLIGLLQGQDMRQGNTSTGPNAVYLLNTGVMRLTQDPGTGLFKLEGRNINKPKTH